MEPLIDLWRSKPETYFEDRLGVTNLWEGEKAILQAIPYAIDKKIKKIVVHSGHSLGKDFTCGGLSPYFLETYGPCIVITTAPTDRQVQKIMWGEISNHYNRAPAPLPGTLLSQEIKLTPDCYAIGFTTKETGTAIGKFQGFHSPRVFVIASEAQAIDDAVFEQIDAILTGEIGLLIEIGNPLRNTGQFAKDIKDAKNNIVIHLNCLDNPNYIERKTVVPGLCSYEWVEDKRKRWGEDDPRWISRVLGLVPSSSIDTVFSQKIIDKILKYRTLEAKDYRGVACDVARFGDDETAIYAGRNGEVTGQDIYSGVDTVDTASRVVIQLRQLGGNFIVVDGDGIGGGSIDTLRHMELKDIAIHEIHSQAASPDEQYANFKAYMWFKILERAKDGKCSLPDDPLLLEELLETKYFINKRGKIQIEAKEDIKERLGRSPDRADAWIMLQYGFSIAEPLKKKDAWRDTAGSGVSRGGVAASAAGVGAMAG